MSRNLVIYYSRRGQNYSGGSIVELERGNAELLAEYISEATGADMFEIRTVREYPADYTECTEAAKEELKKNARPRLEEYLSDVDDYDNIFVVGPCWWGTYPMPVFSLLERLDFRNKRVMPVMTHEGSGMGSAEKDLKKFLKGAKIVKGVAIQGSKVSESEAFIKEWAVRNIR